MQITDFEKIRADKIWYDIKSKKPILFEARQVSLQPNKVYFLINAKGVIANWYKVNVAKALDIPFGYRLFAVDVKNKSLIAKLMKSDRVMF